jgi:hypothetical protein
MDQPNPEAEIAQFDMDKEFPEFRGWEAIGFHRPVGAELWELAIEMIENVLYIFILVYLVPLLRPFPEIEGYRNLANALFFIVFVIFDTGTNFDLGRFIAEYRQKNPRKMMEYVNFVLRYQMWTGLIQVTALSYYIFRVFIYGEYGYLVWIILLEMQKQYPGMLGIFKGVLHGMQQFAATQVMNLVQHKGIEFFVNIGFILLGRAYGEANPEVGIIMGMAIFGAVGNYIDDLIMLPVSGYYLNKVMKKGMGFSLLEALHFKVGKDVYQKALRYGLPASILPIISSSWGLYMTIVQSTMIPGYITLFALAQFGGNLTGIIGQFGDFNLRMMVAEAYCSGKIELAEFYITNSLRWRFFFRCLIACAIFAAFPYLAMMLQVNQELRYYETALVFLLPTLFRRFLEPLFEIFPNILHGAEKINQDQLFSLIEINANGVLFILYMFVFKVYESMNGLIFLWVFSGWVTYLLTKVLISAYYIKKRNLMTIKINWMQTMIIPLICSLPAIVFARVFFYTGFPLLIGWVGFNVATVICYTLFFLILLFSYFPLTVLLGGWDDYQFFIFSKAVDLSGPSKFLFKPLYKMMVRCVAWGKKIGTHGKFPIPFEVAHKQIEELMAQKREFRNEILEEKVLEK